MILRLATPDRRPLPPRAAPRATVVADQGARVWCLVAGVWTAVVVRAQHALAGCADATAHGGKILPTLVAGKGNDLGHVFRLLVTRSS